MIEYELKPIVEWKGNRLPVITYKPDWDIKWYPSSMFPQELPELRIQMRELIPSGSITRGHIEVLPFYFSTMNEEGEAWGEKVWFQNWIQFVLQKLEFQILNENLRIDGKLLAWEKVTDSAGNELKYLR